MISCCWRCLSSLYLAWIAFSCGATDCSFCIEWNCLTVSGSRSARIRIVRNTIDKPHETPTLLWKNFRTDSKTSISGWKMLAMRNMVRRPEPSLLGA